MQLCKYLIIIKVNSRNFTANSATVIPNACQNERYAALNSIKGEKTNGIDNFRI